MSSAEWVLLILKYFSFEKGLYLGLYWAFTRNVRTLGICANNMVFLSRDLCAKKPHFTYSYIYGNIVLINTSAASHRGCNSTYKHSAKVGFQTISDIETHHHTPHSQHIHLTRLRALKRVFFWWFDFLYRWSCRNVMMDRVFSFRHYPTTSGYIHVDSTSIHWSALNN